MHIMLQNIQTKFTQPTIPLLPYNHHTWKRRRLKLPRHHLPCHVTSSSSSFESLYTNLISHIPLINSNTLLALAPAIGLAILINNNNSNKLLNSVNSVNSVDSVNSVNSVDSVDHSVGDVGEWILFTSATPFNRFVTLRCPSMSFEGGELKEERHFGTMRVGESGGFDEDLVYRRVCVGTGDGGVISMDWPETLEMEEERGMDTTAVIVPGTAEGSGETCVREFVCECLRHGWFPVVVNPRGCGGSPLTTPRLFSAADSDDVSTAIEYIKKARPWSTMVAVGWGYGANMLTKYLAEVGEQTPLTASTCINNPFDLEEATRCSPHHIYDKNMTNGLIEILQSNKELFQGRTKRFDVVKALSSKSVRDFEKAISMVAYGFDALEEFYANFSTMHEVKKVKIPTLFIQINDGSVPVFSVPRHLIAENPFTSLLLCSSFPSSKLLTARLTLSWCQHLTIEWLTAVELGLLKGRHPLVMDVDVTLNPKGFELPDKHVSGIERGKGKKLRNILTSHASDEHSLDSSGTPFEETNTSNNICPRFRRSSQRISQIQKGGNPAEGKNGQVLQTAQVVMNILDVTKPDALTDEQKKEVLTAVDQGESVMKAFQDAVPENVREELTTAVSDILQNKTSNIKLDELLHLQDIPNVASVLKSNVQEEVKSPHSECDKDESNSNQMRRSDDPLVVSQPTTGNQEHQSSKDLEKPINTEQFYPNRSNGSDTSATEKDVGPVEDTDRSMIDIEHSLNVDSGPETGSKSESSSQSEEAGLTHDSIEKENVVLDDDKSEQSLTNSNSDPQHEEIIADSSTDKENTSVTTLIENNPILPASSPEMQLNNESPENDKKDVGNMQPSHNEDSSSSPSFNVTQALDAFTGIDDSTQMAVNSVFHVIEDMITQLADEKDNKTEAKDKKKGENQETVSSSVEHLEHNNHKMKGTSKHPDVADDLSSCIKLVSGEELTQDPVTLDKCGNFQDNSNDTRLRCDTMSMIGDKKPLSLESTSALFLEYIPEESQWKLTERSDNEIPKDPCNDIVVDAKEHKLDGELPVSELHGKSSKGYILSVKSSIVDALVVDVGRRLSATYMQEMKSELSGDVEHVANAVCLALKDEGPFNKKVLGSTSEEISILQGEHVTRAVSSALLETVILKKTLPVGVVVGSCLATLKKFSNVEVVDRSSETEEPNTRQAKSGKVKETEYVVLEEVGQKDDSDNKRCESKVNKNSSSNNAAVVGAMSAAVGASAVGASALLVHQQGNKLFGASQHLKEKKNAHKEPASSDRIVSEKNNENLVTSLAEKAMSVASPVVPTKEDGEVDQEKLVAMLAEVGQKGGVRLFGKVALLWGGIRGAMSLTDKLISFLHLADRPLYQRISGFICMVLVLWSPVVVPLLPSIVQKWTTRRSSKFTDLSCIIGLYASIFILITSWGRRIHGYENPLEHYGLDLNSSVKGQEFLRGLVGGVILVSLIQSLNFALGCVNLHYPTPLPLPSSGALIWIKVYGKILVLMIKGLVTATGISLVEELLFRSWLSDEIASDLGYHQGIIISGLLFSLFQRSPLAIPGLWLLSLALTGARERSEGRLWLPIGLRAGMLASSFIIQMSGYITYQPNFPLWVTGTHPLQPFSGVIGLSAALILALILYPRQQHKKLNRTIKD